MLGVFESYVGTRVDQKAARKHFWGARLEKKRSPYTSLLYFSFLIQFAPWGNVQNRINSA